MTRNSSDLTIADAMECPKCGSPNCYEFSTDEINFDADGSGIYQVDCSCVDCKATFRLCMQFEYKVTKAWVRK